MTVYEVIQNEASLEDTAGFITKIVTKEIERYVKNEFGNSYWKGLNNFELGDIESRIIAILNKEYIEKE